MARSRPRAEDVVRFVDEHAHDLCAACGGVSIGHDAVLSLLMGHADAVTCIPCLARQHGREISDFLEHARGQVAALACYRAGWCHADARLDEVGGWSDARMPIRMRMTGEVPDAQGDGEVERAAVPAPDAFLGADAQWDAGDRGCGELALELKLRLGSLGDGQRLHLVTTDLGAPADIPAWCRLTGNDLVEALPPHFLIARTRKDPTTP